ncbi:MAG: 30S ribosomal protein S14 [Alphaproteobacteria bacterium]
MAKTSFIERNKKREKMVVRFAARRKALKALANDESLSMNERFEARLRLAKLPRNGSRTRVRLLCELTGRSRGNYRKFKLSRIKLRELANNGLVPGIVKSSW